MKELLLKPQLAFDYKLDIDVLDFPKGRGQEPRKRCTIEVDFSRRDVDELKAKGLDLDGTMDYYEKDIYRMVDALIGLEFTFVGGLDESLAIIREKAAKYFA